MRIVGELTIYTASHWKERLLSALSETGDVELELSEVTEIDSAGLQLLLLLRRETQASGKAIRVLAASRCVNEVLSLCQLNGSFEASTPALEGKEAA